MNKCLPVMVISLSLAGLARGDAFDRVPEGASIYGELRPVALSGALKRLGIDQLPAVARIKQQVGGIDILDPALLAPTGLDVASPVAASLEFSTADGLTHGRLVATLRDSSMFRTFLGAVAAAGQLPIQPVAADAPEAKLGVIATASWHESVMAVLRIAGDSVIVDGVDVWDKKALSAAEVARKYPLEVAKPFVPGKGARKLLGSDTALAVYSDARHFTELLEAVYREDLADDLKRAAKAKRAAMKQQRLARMKKCLAEWQKAPATFDDAALALSADPKEVRLTLGWGAHTENELRFVPVDDGGVDYDFLSKQAPVVAALFAASAAPFTALKRGGFYTSASSLTEFGKRCGDQVNIGVALRGWPLAIGAGLSELKKPSTTQSTGLDLSSALNAFGQLRNVVLVVRDATSAQSAQFAISATFDNTARTLLESLLAIFGGGSGTPKSLAPKRTPTVYSISNPNVGSFVGALENLPKGHVMFTFADSDESLQLSYRKPTPMPNVTAPARGTTPIAALHLDGGMVARILSNLGAADSAKAAIDLMARLKRVDADLASEGDLFRLVVRAPIK